MAEFPFTDSYHRFEQNVKKRNRYVYGPEVRDFLEVVIEISESRKDSIPKLSILFRAQRGYGWRLENAGTDEEYESPDAFEPARMVPNAEFVNDGRVNPRGIPCLYMATTAETAMAEVRPWVGSYISLAQFKVMRDVTVVDCSKDKRMFPNWLLHEPQQEIPPEKREQIVWGDIGHALSRPITPDDPVTDYVPTQILAEAFRAHGFDGIVYRSLLGEGLNVALFDCSAAELINCGLYEASGVRFQFDQRGNPYFTTKHYEELEKQEEPIDAAKEEPLSSS
jgi:RES domain